MRGLLCLFGAVLLWSTAEVVTRVIIDRITPLQLSFFRFFIGGLVLAPLLPRTLRQRNLRVSGRVLAHALWMSLIGVVASSVCYQYSLKWTGAGVVATMFGLSPLLTFFMAGVLLNEEMTFAKIAGLSVAFAGVGVLTLSHPSPAFSLLGLFLALGSSACFALFTVLVKKYAGAYGGLPITVFCAMFGALFLAPLVLHEGQVQTLGHWREIGPAVLYVAIGTTGVAYLLYFQGLEIVDATYASSALFLKPPLATALATLCLGEPVTWNLAVAIALILGGLYLVIVLNRYALTRSTQAASRTRDGG